MMKQMMDDEGISTSLDDHSGIAYQMLDVLEHFADTFSDRLIPGHLEQVLQEGKYLKAKQVGQKPERFVEEHLIWPTLNVLGFTFLSQPYGYPKFTRDYPDFAIQNFDCGYGCAVVGEIKTLNKVKYAEDDIEGYLKKDLTEPTVGIATDGIHWKVYARPEREARQDELIGVDFSEAFKRMILRHTEEESYAPHQTRKLVEEAERLHRPAVEERVSEFLSGFEE